MKFAKWISYHPKTVILIAAILLVPSILCYFATGINYDILSYLPENVRSVQGERILDEKFNNASSSFIVIKNYNQKDVYKLKQKIEKIPGVHSVTSANTIADVSIPQEIYPDVLKSAFYSDDGSSTLMMVQYTEDGASQSTMDAIKSIRKELNKNSFLAGTGPIMVDTKNLADKEAPIYIAIAIVLALIVLSFTMDSVVLPFVLLAALCLAVAYNMGTNIFFGKISYITQSIAAILQLGVTMDYSVFLMDRFREEVPKFGGNQKEAMANAITQTFTSLAGSSLTTIFGFLALCFMQFRLGLDLGLVMAKGVLLGVITVVTVLPAMILLLEKPIERTHHRSLAPTFVHSSNFTVKHRRVISVVFLILFIPAYLVSQKLDVYYNMDKSLPKNMDSVVALSNLKSIFNMSTTHFVICDENLASSKMNDMVNEIENVKGVTKVLSLSGVVGSAIPLEILPDEVKNVCVAGGKQLMMINSKYAGATDDENAQIDKINAIVQKYDSSAYLTGEGVLEKDLITVTNHDFTVTNIISIVSIFVLVAICLQSISLPIILVAAIELAILLNLAISAILGTVEPFIAPTIIGCVQLGATVDYAILLATRFKEEIQNGLKKEEAMKIASSQASRSIYQSALVFFVATFGVYLACNISIVKSICAMLARGAIISAIVIIFMVTPVLTCCNKFIGKTTLYWYKPKVRKSKLASASGAPLPPAGVPAAAKVPAKSTKKTDVPIKQKKQKFVREIKGDPYHPAPPPFKTQTATATKPATNEGTDGGNSK